MPTPPYCPSCFVKLEPDMRACPNCPMSFPEDDDLPKAASNPLKQSPYYQWAMPALFFVALGGLIWWLASGFFRLGEENAAAPSVGVAAAAKAGGERETAAFSTAAFASAANTSPSNSGGSSYEGSGTVSVAPAVEAPPPPAASEPPPKPVKAVKEWKLRGRVYDLTTLKPLSGCQLTFVDVETNRNIHTRTDAEGRYRALVPSLPDRGYALKAEKSGYSLNYLDPSTEGVRAMGAAARKELAKGLADTLTATPASLQAEGAAPLITDVYLAPRR
ncbi:MAG: carboxypeptidase regulatory-like domain-containing protein [Elusimicrobia bacterium]|nr:carboxypeptidase regulatory-like domain-containing protein [Elusimicrobiota bacterium]